MNYEWDRNKANRNLEKHGVDFADAVVALEDPLAMTLRDPDSETEERFVTLATDPAGQLIVVVHTWRGKSLRIISARKATRRERLQYEGE